jgi:Ca-activated chloride channel family protein
MTFETPIALFALLLIPLVLIGYVFVQRRRVKYAVRFTNLDLLANVAHGSPGWRRHLPPVLYVVALVALVISLARPHAVVLVPKEQATVMLVMDVSGSMDATDVAPSRLVAAQRAALSFLDQLPGTVRVGLISFSSTVQTLAAPTTDRAQIRSALGLLRASSGTAMGDGLMRALEIQIASDTAPPATPSPSASPGAQPANTIPLAVVLLSDGANTLGTAQPLDAAEQADQLGVPVYTIALGTPGGTITAATGRGGALQTINVPPDLDTLRQIAEITGAGFFEAPTENDLRAIYEDLGSRVGFTEEQMEVTALFAGLGLAFMLFGGALAAVWFNRIP